MSDCAKVVARLTSGFTSSILFANWESFGFERRLLTTSSSELDLITTPLFLVGEPVDGSTGFISIANEVTVDLSPGNLSKNNSTIVRL